MSHSSPTYSSSATTKVGAMSAWQYSLKWLTDKLVSIIALILLLPLWLLCLLLYRHRPIYTQERIGKHGKPFSIYKIRTMVREAEADGPRLSSERDDRILPGGVFLRKYRLDELPQFWNILKGDMSLVGPRPERMFYIEQIVQQAPWYQMLLNVKPGLTSWGMVNYGYANTVEQMVERARYDLTYIRHQSVGWDLQIAVQTVKIILKGKGM